MKKRETVEKSIIAGDNDDEQLIVGRKPSKFYFVIAQVEVY